MNPEDFATNMGVLQARWPWLAEQILGAEGAREVVLDGETLMVNGIHLTSMVDRKAEARTVAEGVSAGVREVNVYGFALGDTVAELLRRGTPKVVVHVLNPSIFGLAIAVQAIPWLKDDRLEFSPSSDLNYPFVVAPACLSLCAPEMFVLRDAVMLALARPHLDRAMDRGRARAQQNAERNRSLALRDSDASAWLRAQGWPDVWVAAAGPTLLESLKRWGPSRGKLIAVGRALKALLSKGIRPDVVVSVDSSEIAVDQFTGVSKADIGECVLLYSVSTDCRIVEGWPGRRRATLLQYEAHCHLGAQWPFERLFAGGSVIHTAVDAAVIAGARSVFLAGADLSFPDESSHVEGAVHRTAVGPGRVGQIRVLDGHGGQVPTNLAMAGFLRELEDYIVAHPAIRFIATSRRGARISGTEFLEE